MNSFGLVADKRGTKKVILKIELWLERGMISLLSSIHQEPLVNPKVLC